MTRIEPCESCGTPVTLARDALRPAWDEIACDCFAAFGCGFECAERVRHDAQRCQAARAELHYPRGRG